MTATNPIKDAVTQARQRQILEAAVTVFAEKGYHRATIKDIAQTAGVADGTIYNYFKNKQDVMLNIVLQMAEVNRLMENVEQAVQVLTLAQLLEMVFQNRLRTLKNNLPLTRAIFPQIITDPELRRMFFEKLLLPNLEKGEEIFQLYAERGQLSDVDPKIVTRGLFSVIFGTIMLAMVGDTGILDEAETFSNQMTEIFLRGLQVDQPEHDQ